MLDYLAFEAKGQPAKLNIQDRELLRRFEILDKLSDKIIYLALNTNIKNEIKIVKNA